MSTYAKTLDALKQCRTLAAHITALGKLKANAQDATLAGLLDRLIVALQNDHARASKGKSTPIELAKSTAREVNDLTTYCQKAIGAKKPEWQIQAERAGWTPPKGQA